MPVIDHDTKESRWGRILVLKSHWNASLLDQYRERKCVGVELNTARGWHGDNIKFLSEMENLLYVDIINHSSNKVDETAIQGLTSLKYLGIDTYGQVPIDFAVFSRLETCYLEWRKGFESITNCKSLRHLYINRLREADLNLVAGLVSLRSLLIGNAPLRSLCGITTLQALRHFSIYNSRNLHETNQIATLGSLELLEVNGCRLKSVHLSADLCQSLKWLSLSNNGPIESLKSLSYCKNLKVLLFTGSTLVRDGDLTFINQLHRLKILSFMNRKHYSQRREAFIQYLQPENIPYPEFGTEPDL